MNTFFSLKIVIFVENCILEMKIEFFRKMQIFDEKRIFLVTNFEIVFYQSKIDSLLWAIFIILNQKVDF